MLPDATVVAALPPEVTASIVVVAAPPAHTCCATPQKAMTRAIEKKSRKEAGNFMGKLHSRFYRFGKFVEISRTQGEGNRGIRPFSSGCSAGGIEQELARDSRVQFGFLFKCQNSIEPV
jgi:hypothetical protein